MHSYQDAHQEALPWGSGPKFYGSNIIFAIDWAYHYHKKHLNICFAIWYLSHSYEVLPIDIENPYRLSSYSDIYRVLGIIVFSNLLLYVKSLPVGDNSTVNTLTSLHIFDQLGTENACLNIMLICRHGRSSCVQKYVTIWASFRSFYSNPTILETFRQKSMGQHGPGVLIVQSLRLKHKSNPSIVPKLEIVQRATNTF